uniref:Uncharacterized protein n=1 Tax=Lactuca sativa TaxID=4236 RepID=A0A9R1X7C7_LACSA|nr:hypothetical protein LSAT_V11C500258740 [Lactuca sativa]
MFDCLQVTQCQESEYNEEESSGDEDEIDGDEDLCDEDEEYFDVNQVSAVEMEDLKKDLIVKIDEGVLKYPQNYGNDFLNGDENVEDDDQGKCYGAQGDGSGPHREILVKIMLKVMKTWLMVV